jgi:ketosteroid isomerase-like protein
MTDEDRVLAANEAFYAAFRARDIAAMDALWARERQVAVYHPGWPGIEGREGVMESWYRILVAGSTPDIRPLDPTVILNGTTAIVFCTEDLGDSSAIASNTFVREDGAWRLAHHQAAGLPARASSNRQGKG